MTKSKQPKT